MTRFRPGIRIQQSMTWVWANEYMPGMTVLCEPSEKGVPDIVDLQTLGFQIGCITPTELTDNRDIGIYKVIKSWFPDSKRFPMYQFLICIDARGYAVFTTFEARVIDGF